MTKRMREGVTEEVNERMDALEADVLSEDNLLFRVCVHGVRHPVGHLSRALVDRDFETRHHVPGEPSPFIRQVPCCAEQCCAVWRAESVA